MTGLTTSMLCWKPWTGWHWQESNSLSLIWQNVTELSAMPQTGRASGGRGLPWKGQ